MWRVKRAIWRRTNAGSDGSLNGDQRFDFRPSRVPGAEANLMTILRNARETRPVICCSSLGYPPTTTLRFILHDLKRDESVKPLFISFSHERLRFTHNTYVAPLYVIPFIPATYPSRTPALLSHHIASNSISCPIRPCLLAFILPPGLIPAFLQTPQS